MFSGSWFSVMLLNHSNHTAAGFKSPTEESLIIGKWLEDFITFTGVFTQTLKVLMFSSR